MNTNISKNTNTPLFTQIQTLIANARTRVATVVNQELVNLYWAIGHHIRQDILHANRAEYGNYLLRQHKAKLRQRAKEIQEALMLDLEILQHISETQV